MAKFHASSFLVEYVQPEYDELKKEFDKSGGRHEWHLHPSYLDIDQSPGKRTMVVRHFGRKMRSEKAITEMHAWGYRPATHLELYAFAKAYPKLQPRSWIIALGAFLLDEFEQRFVSARTSFKDGLPACFVNDFWFNCAWTPDFRFLFVRR